MPDFDRLLLIIPDKRDIERDAVAEAWQENGGDILRLGRFWEPPVLEVSQVRLYGPDTFCLVLAQQLNLDLVSPTDDLLIHLDEKWLKRQIQVHPLQQVARLDFPLFAKPLIPKQFRANVYPNKDALLDECKGLSDDISVVVSSLVNFIAEARTFTLDGQVKTCAIYEGIGDENEAHRFASIFAEENQLPKTCVIDVGYVENSGWAVIEANATWGSGLNGCDPLGAAECIAQATLFE